MKNGDSLIGFIGKSLAITNIRRIFASNKNKNGE